MQARGSASGLQLDSGWSVLIDFREEMVLSAWDWLDRDEGPNAAGRPQPHA